jgi:hypothetical protein
MLWYFRLVEQLQAAFNAYKFVTLIKNQEQGAHVLRPGIFRL